VRTAVSTLDLRQPGSLREALTILRDEPRTPLAGGTDLYVALNFGTLESRRFLDLHRLDELRAISTRGETLVLGAMVTFSRLIRHPAVTERLPMLGAAARLIGGVQIQNRGTLGGNIANGSPAGDSLPVLLAAEATIVLRSADQERRVPFSEFYTGYRTSVRRPDELLVAVEIPPVSGQQYFRKVGTRAAQAISKVVLAGVRGPAPRVALGSVGPVPLRARRTEAALARDDLDRAVQELASEIAPIDDIRSSAAYRRTVAANLLREFWTG
jgi:xanthine dehydrogenase small subunit